MSMITTGSGVKVKPENSTRTLDLLIDRVREDSVADYINQHCPERGIVGIICSTVNNARDTAQDMVSRFGDVVTLAHSRFIPPDRFEKDSKVLEIAGKTSNRDTFQIVVGTQVLEQSLDIDFDLLLSEVAPVDSLVQRMGRLHRHQRANRPCLPRFGIIQHEEEISSRRVYGDWLIDVAETYFNDRARFSLPTQIEEAIEFLPLDFEISPPYIQQNIMDRENLKRAKPWTINAPTAKLDRSIHDIFKHGDNENYADARVRGSDSGAELIAVFTNENGLYYVPYIENNERKEHILTLDDDISWVETLRILGSSLRMPMHLSGIRQIEEFESLTPCDVKLTWNKSKILKNELPMVFDKNGILELSDAKLSYDPTTGFGATNV